MYFLSFCLSTYLVLGFGERSWRYSAVIADGVVEKIFVEGGAVTQGSGPDPFEVSDADTMLSYLTSKVK